jgi:glycogen debranching enzyme
MANCLPFLFSFSNAVLLWLLVAVSVKLGRPHIGRNALELMEQRLAKDDFPEYYDGRAGRYVGKQARKFQTWSVAGYLVAKMLLDDPTKIGIVSLPEDGQIREPVRKRSNSFP